MNEEMKDQELFNRIAINYAKKDTYGVSLEVRKFQIISLVNLCHNNKFNNILELGCGAGYNALYLKEQYKSYTGIDYSEEFVKIANGIKIPHAKFIQANIKDLQFLKDNNFDLIFGVGVLHHVDDTVKVMNNIRNICDDNTILAFIEPFSGNYFIQFLRNIRKIIDKSYSNDQRFFKRDELIDLFRNSGYEILKIKYQGYFSPPFAQVILKPELFFKHLCKFSIVIDKLIQNKFNIPLSWNIICTARKQNV